MIVRKAEARDKGYVLDMARNFYEVTDYEEHIPYDYESCGELFDRCVEQGLCFVADNGTPVGFVLGLAFPSMMNKDYMIGAELAWWVQPEFRGIGFRLLRSIETEAREMGVKIWSMMALESLEPEVAEAIYLKAGYIPTERTYSRYN